jgi:hypothetical protein
MNNDNAEIVFYVLLMAVFSVMFAFIGISQGKDTACQSIGLEWHKDKCVKVTREPVK